MSDKKLPIFREILCDLCDSKHRKQCDRDEFQPRCIHLQAMLNNVIAEAQLEAIERYESLYDCTFRADYECGENVQTGKSFIAQKSYLAELKKAAGRGKDEK